MSNVTTHTAGLEPTTLRLTAECSTIELRMNTDGGTRTRTVIRPKVFLATLCYHSRIITL